jgi:hypothetical protein
MNRSIIYYLIFFCLFTQDYTLANTFTVSNPGDNGPGTLRFVIENQAEEGDTIRFSSGITEIMLAAELTLSYPVTIIGNGPDLLSINGNHTTRIFNITGGNIKIDQLSLINGFANQGGAILKEIGALDLDNVVISNCEAIIEGGAVYNKSGDLSISRTEILNNTSIFGAGIYHREGMAFLREVRIEDNQASLGGGLAIEGGNLFIGHSAFLSNAATSIGGGIYGDEGDIIIHSTIIAGNSVAGNLGGGIYHSNGNLSLTNSLVSGNKAEQNGGGIFHSNAGLNVQSTTISGNWASEEGGGIYSLSDMVMVNSIVWGNNNQIEGTEDTNIRFSIIQGGGFPGEGNLDQDPAFLNAINADSAPTQAGDFRLSLNSPAIDAGTLDTIGLAIPDFDLDGNPRFLDRIDIGAYENSICLRPYLYATDFEGGAQGWRTGPNANVNVWSLGTPNGETINTASSGENAWFTDLSTFEAFSSYYLYSPCFDFGEAERPMLSLRYFSNSLQGADGAVVQYLANNGANGESWQTLGEDSQLGLGWYNGNAIAAMPAGQGHGWTGNATGWQTASYALDELKGMATVNFRIAYSGVGSANDGFAIDDFSIRERVKTVLLEQFTSLDIIPNPGEVQEALNVFTTENLADLAIIQYHFEDDIYDDYINGPNTRLEGYYGGATGQLPLTIIDGLSYNGPTLDMDGKLGWTDSLSRKAVLRPAYFRLDSLKTGICVNESEPRTLFYEVQVETLGDLPPDIQDAVENQMVTVRLAIVEDLVSVGDTLRNVLRQYLPLDGGLDGVNVTDGLIEGKWALPSYIQDPSNLKAVIFIQNNSFPNLEVYQAFVLDIPVNKAPTAGLQTITLDVADVYTFSEEDLDYADPENDPMAYIEILFYNGDAFWDFDGELVVPGDTIPAESLGLLTITPSFDNEFAVGYRVSDGKNVSIEYLLEFTVTVLGNEEVKDLAKNISLFPNPFEESLNIQFDLPAWSTDLKLEIINTLGQSIYRMDVGQIMNQNIILDTHSIPPGYYICKFTDGEAQASKTIIRM